MKTTNHLLAVVFLCALSAVAVFGQSKETPAPSETDEIREIIEGKDFVLVNNAGKCRLVFGEQAIDLKIPWRCDFHRSPEKKVRVFPRDFYADKKKRPKNYPNTQIVLIEYSTVSPDNPKDCRTQLQAVKIVNGSKVTASKTPSNLASCPPFQWEDKNFIGVFE